MMTEEMDENFQLRDWQRKSEEGHHGSNRNNDTSYVMKCVGENFK